MPCTCTVVLRESKLTPNHNPIPREGNNEYIFFLGRRLIVLMTIECIFCCWMDWFRSIVECIVSYVLFFFCFKRPIIPPKPLKCTEHNIPCILPNISSDVTIGNEVHTYLNPNLSVKFSVPVLSVSYLSRYIFYRRLPAFATLALECKRSLYELYDFFCLSQ